MSVSAYLSHGGGAANNPELVVVHAMGEFITMPDRTLHAVSFLNEVKLSAHALVAPDGTVFRCRRDGERAWHARGHNTNSLGIEFLVPGEHDYGSFLDAIRRPYLTPKQYHAGRALVREWLAKYPGCDVVRHSDLDPGRKLDPGKGFPWEKFKNDMEI